MLLETGSRDSLSYASCGACSHVSSLETGLTTQQMSISAMCTGWTVQPPDSWHLHSRRPTDVSRAACGMGARLWLGGGAGEAVEGQVRVEVIRDAAQVDAVHGAQLLCIHGHRRGRRLCTPQASLSPCHAAPHSF